MRVCLFQVTLRVFLTSNDKESLTLAREHLYFPCCVHISSYMHIDLFMYVRIYIYIYIYIDI